MSVTMTLVTQARMDTENYISGTETVTGDNGQKISDTVAGITANAALAVTPFTVAKLQAIYVVADVNSTLSFLGSPATAVNLVAGVPWSWSLASGIACPITANCTGANLAVPTAANCTVTGRLVTVV